MLEALVLGLPWFKLVRTYSHCPHDERAGYRRRIDTGVLAEVFETYEHALRQTSYYIAGPGNRVISTRFMPGSRSRPRWIRAVFSPGALPEKTKQLIDIVHTTHCSYCIAGHTQLARRNGASDEENMKAFWTAAEMRAGGAYAHSSVALHALGHAQAWRGPPIGTSGRGRCLLVPATRTSA